MINNTIQYPVEEEKTMGRFGGVGTPGGGVGTAGMAGMETLREKNFCGGTVR